MHRQRDFHSAILPEHIIRCQRREKLAVAVSASQEVYIPDLYPIVDPALKLFLALIYGECHKAKAQGYLTLRL